MSGLNNFLILILSSVILGCGGKVNNSNKGLCNGEDRASILVLGNKFAKQYTSDFFGQWSPSNVSIDIKDHKKCYKCNTDCNYMTPVIMSFYSGGQNAIKTELYGALTVVDGRLDFSLTEINTDLNGLNKISSKGGAILDVTYIVANEVIKLWKDIPNPFREKYNPKLDPANSPNSDRDVLNN